MPAGLYCPEEYVSPSVYAQAGFPGYQQPPYYPGVSSAYCHNPYPVGGMMGLAGSYTPGVPCPTTAVPYLAPGIASGAATASATQPLATQESEEVLRERINAKIDSILHAERVSRQERQGEAMASQIEQLHRKVQKLEMQSTRPSSDVADHLHSRDEEITRRLHSLSAESARAERQTERAERAERTERAEKADKRQRDRIPDW